MNIVDFLNNLLPISSATLSLIAALISTIVTSKFYKKRDKTQKNIHIKINDHEINLAGLEEKDVIELLEKFSHEKTMTEQFPKNK